jgi:hypothetical protein
MHRNLIEYPFLTVVFIALSLFGCSITQEVYLQEVEVKGPVFQPPVFIADSTESGQFRLAPHISFGRNRTFRGSVEGHTRVNSSGVYQLDTTYAANEVTLRETPGANVHDYSGQNLRWDTPEVMVGVQGDLALTRIISVTFGGVYSAMGSEGFLGGSVGLGFHTVNATLATRIDGGIHWTPTAYDALTVVVTNVSAFGNSSQDVAVFHDIGTDANMGFYGALTLNTRREDWPLNVFLNLAVSRQRLTHYEPHTSVFPAPFVYSFTIKDARTSSSATFVSLTPGVYLTMTGGHRVLLGARWNKGTDGVTEGFISPFVKYEILF